MIFKPSFGIVVAFLLAVSAQGEASEEYQVKAAFLFNFAKFVEWPPQSFKSPTDPITICILGRDPFGRSLDDEVGGKSVDRRAFAVRHITEVGQIIGCQILFIAPHQKKPLPQIWIPGVLTVGESEGFVTGGGVIGFKLENGKVRLEISVEAAEQRKLRISSKLLSLAQIVKSRT